MPSAGGRRTRRGPMSSGRLGGATTRAGRIRNTTRAPGAEGGERRGVGGSPARGGAHLRRGLRPLLRPGGARGGQDARKGRGGRVLRPRRGGYPRPVGGLYPTPQTPRAPPPRTPSPA